MLRTNLRCPPPRVAFLTARVRVMLLASCKGPHELHLARRVRLSWAVRRGGEHHTQGKGSCPDGRLWKWPRTCVATSGLLLFKGYSCLWTSIEREPWWIQKPQCPAFKNWGPQMGFRRIWEWTGQPVESFDVCGIKVLNFSYLNAKSGIWEESTVSDKKLVCFLKPVEL